MESPIEIHGDELGFDPTNFWPVLSGGKEVGKVTDAVWSPRLERNIGYAWVPATHIALGTALTLDAHDGTREASVAALPFVDPTKEIPKS